MTTTTETLPEARSSLRALLSDPWVVTAVVWLVVILVVPDDGKLPSIVEVLIHDYISTTLLFIDIDNFKTVNDRYGHRAGDCVLREAAARLRACVREVDTMARYGGDEFVVVLEDLIDEKDAETVARRIGKSMALGFSYESVRNELSASIGIATSCKTGRDPSELLEAADRAMYAIKRSGGGAAGAD